VEVGTDQNVGWRVLGHEGVKHPEIGEQEQARAVRRDPVPTRQRPKDVLEVYSAAGAAGAGAFFSDIRLNPFTSLAALSRS